MSERATFCPRCGHMHTGICPLAKTETSEAGEIEKASPRIGRDPGDADIRSRPEPAPIPPDTNELKAATAAIIAGKPKRDRAAYMRQYRAQSNALKPKR